MNAPRPSLVRLASAIVAAEIVRSDPGREEHVADRILVQLHEHLGKLIGPAGFDVLLARALVLARRADPGLSGCVAGTGGRLSWPPEAEGARGEPSGERGAVAILAHLFELLALLIGAELSVRLARDVWPDLPDTGSARDER